MINIKCGFLNTISMKNNEVYKLDFPGTGYIDVRNNSGGEIEIHHTENADETQRLLLGGGDIYNDLIVHMTIFVTSKTDGKISIVYRG